MATLEARESKAMDAVEPGEPCDVTLASYRPMPLVARGGSAARNESK
jgi:hypothetical protein